MSLWEWRKRSNKCSRKVFLNDRLSMNTDNHKTKPQEPPASYGPPGQLPIRECNKIPKEVREVQETQVPKKQRN
ncbi:hypothetical protein Pmani_036680 [Petrolisthes manimaculis]|uniref:Uncharacterized protein n=1 Tax=Petrolisthes manimaculis TaxID=1843537 RepID=A0AAE1NJM4_9EUCA|nr:hypothetical protein Pmani_036680 [Petrolisthes manimaculis]